MVEFKLFDTKTENILEETQLPILFEPNKKLNNSKKKAKKTEHLNLLSLFSGCGGMDLGFEGGFTTFLKSVNEKLHPGYIDKRLNSEIVLLKRTRFKTVFANDILPAARNVWINHFNKSDKNSSEIFHTDSIVDLVRLHRKGIKVFPNKVNVVIGGFPCQDFSVAGKRNGFNSHKNHKGEKSKHEIATEETRGKLYMWMKEVIEITQPNIFIAENVKGLVNLSNAKEIIQADFSTSSDNGYIVLEPQILHSADYGVSQSRERVIFIGIKKSALKAKALIELSKKEIRNDYNPYPAPTHSFSSQGENLKPIVQLKDIFKYLEEPEKSIDPSQRYYSKAKFMGVHCQGQTEIRLNGIAPTIRAEHHGNIEFRRLSLNHGGKYEEEIKHGLIERRLTPRECALIQSFPSDYEFVIEHGNGKNGRFLVSPSQAYKVIGNAVPPLLAYQIAKRLETIWDIYFKKIK